MLDLHARAEDVRRVARSRPEWSACLRVGWEPHALDSEVWLRLAERQQPGRKSRYDPTRASVTKYLMVQCRGVLLNLLALHRERSLVGATEFDEEVSLGDDDTAEDPYESAAR